MSHIAAMNGRYMKRAKRAIIEDFFTNPEGDSPHRLENTLIINQDIIPRGTKCKKKLPISHLFP